MADTYTSLAGELTTNATALQGIATRVAALDSVVITPPPPPPPPSGTVSTPANPVPLTDKNGLVWTWLAAMFPPYGNYIAINGVQSPYAGVNMQLGTKGAQLGLIVSQNGIGDWWLLTNASTQALTTAP